MRTPMRVRQRMYYAVPDKLIPIYEYDETGGIKHRAVNGKDIPITTGKSEMSYNEPVMFFNSITSDLTADDLASFGVNGAGKKAKMSYKRGEYPFKTGVLIWKDSKVRYRSDGYVDPTSADYMIRGVRDTGRMFFNALLEEITR